MKFGECSLVLLKVFTALVKHLQSNTSQYWFSAKTKKGIRPYLIGANVDLCCLLWTPDSSTSDNVAMNNLDIGPFLNSDSPTDSRAIERMPVFLNAVFRLQ